MSELDILIGKRIIDAAVHTEGKSIVFTTEQGIFIFDAVGDCCSESWIEDVIDYEVLEGQVVTDVVSKDIDREDEHPEHDCLQVYNYDLKTAKGTATIDFRNASNGYYGGWLELRRE